MFYDRKFHTTYSNLGRLEIVMETEIIPGCELLDTEVKIYESGCLCWISFPQKEEFLKELNTIIDKYKI